jgi:hypothetical protein
MTPPVQLARERLVFKPLRCRRNRVNIERDHVAPEAAPRPLSPEVQGIVVETAARIRRAREAGRPVMLAFGAHAIKNGLGPVLIRLMEEGWVTHLATNGAGIIHDWEFAYLGETSEDVAENVARGEFGLWEETGRYINLALLVGAYEGLGYGASVGALIEDDGLRIPSESELKQAAADLDGDTDRSAAATDLLGAVRRFGLEPGRLSVPHPFKRFSAQAAARRLGVPFTGHPMIGHDIIYTHPMNHGAAIGRVALRDFLCFAQAVSMIDGGVYCSVGSAVMSPMIFEKSLSMAQNLAIQGGRHIDRHFVVVVDLARSTWDWKKDGEPPPENPAYYLRFCKTFSRMGGEMRYVSADNRDFLLALGRALRG